MDFFLNQQFITQYVIVDCGSYFVATYRRGRLTCKIKEENEKREKKKRKELIIENQRKGRKRKVMRTENISKVNLD